MGVLTCSRTGCINIMCKRHSYLYGYICDECFEELVNSGPETNIEEFMDSDKPIKVTTDEAYARFNVAFPIKDTEDAPDQGSMYELERDEDGPR